MSRWCEAMESATHLRLPWRLLREKLAPTQPGFPILDVHYKLTLELLDTDLIVSTMCFFNLIRWFVVLCSDFFFVVSLSRDNNKDRRYESIRFNTGKQKKRTASFVRCFKLMHTYQFAIYRKFSIYRHFIIEFSIIFSSLENCSCRLNKCCWFTV